MTRNYPDVSVRRYSESSNCPNGWFPCPPVTYNMCDTCHGTSQPAIYPAKTGQIRHKDWCDDGVSVIASINWYPVFKIKWYLGELYR